MFEVSEQKNRVRHNDRFLAAPQFLKEQTDSVVRRNVTFTRSHVVTPLLLHFLSNFDWLLNNQQFRTHQVRTHQGWLDFPTLSSYPPFRLTGSDIAPNMAPSP